MQSLLSIELNNMENILFASDNNGNVFKISIEN